MGLLGRIGYVLTLHSSRNYQPPPPLGTTMMTLSGEGSPGSVLPGVGRAGQQVQAGRRKGSLLEHLETVPPPCGSPRPQLSPYEEIVGLQGSESFLQLKPSQGSPQPSPPWLCVSQCNALAMAIETRSHFCT